MGTSFLNAVAYFVSSFNIGYLVFALLLLLIRIFRKTTIRHEAINILSAVNLAFLIGLLLEMILYAVEMFISYYGQSKYEFFVFAENPYNQIFGTVSILIYLIGILFLFKRFRKSWVLTLLMVFLLILNLFPDLLLSLFREYLPSAWKTDYAESVYHYFFKTLIFATLVFAVYLLLTKLKKLPYSSLWIK